MNFLIRNSFAAFIDDIPKGNTVYMSAFTKGVSDKAKGYVLLTTDVVGTIHAVHLQFESDDNDAAGAATHAFDKLENLLELAGMKCRAGVLLTAGLTEAIEVYGNNPAINTKVVDDYLASQSKEGVDG